MAEEMSFGEQYVDPMTPGNMDTQYQWHTAFRDSAKNMYRTSYQDQIHNRDVHVKSDFPAGYGGSNPTFRHDIRFKNSELYKIRHLSCTDVSRDAYPNFDANITGVPGFCYNPRGAKKVPTMGQIPINPGSLLKAPWAITAPQQILNYRKAPPLTSSMRRTAHEHRMMTQTLPRATSELELPGPAAATMAPPKMAASESMPALPSAGAEMVAPTKASELDVGPPTAMPMMSQTFSSGFGATAPNPGGTPGSMNRALLKSLNQSSAKAGYALNLMGAPPKK